MYNALRVVCEYRFCLISAGMYVDFHLYDVYKCSRTILWTMPVYTHTHTHTHTHTLTLTHTYTHNNVLIQWIIGPYIHAYGHTFLFQLDLYQ